MKYIQKTVFLNYFEKNRPQITISKDPANSYQV